MIDLSFFYHNSLHPLHSKGYGARVAPSELAQDLNLPRDRREWSKEQQVKYGSAAFERGTQWLIDAVLGKRPWPGETGEAAQYWEEVEADKVMLFNTGRITILNGVILCDARGLGRIIDPRSFVRAIQEFILPKVNLEALRPEKLTIKDHGSTGHRYTLDCIPNHPKKNQVDYTAGTLERLSAAERKKAGDTDIDCSWGGRRTVAGSAWNAPSLLEPQEVIELL